MKSEGPSSPRNPLVHLVDADSGPHLFVVDGSGIFGLSDDLADRFRRSIDDPIATRTLLAELGLDGPSFLDGRETAKASLRSLSLAVAQKCNLACSYCYAQEGGFGGEAKEMSEGVALKAVHTLLEGCVAGDHATLAFLGGEPLLNRRVLRSATEYAARLAGNIGVKIHFSITSNGTLVTADDAAFFEEHGFAVTISVDGLADAHDRLRKYKGGGGSFDRIMCNVRPLLTTQRKMQVSARATVTPRNLGLLRTLDALIVEGFHSVGFSPLLASPTGCDQMDPTGLERMLEQMIACGRQFEARVIAGDRYPFANMVTAMKELHRGAHRPYPCGAGGGYLGVSADGELSACHRFVGDATGAMGHIDTGVDLYLQTRWLSDRHVDRQEPCRSCWARYLCGGGCHHEVLARGRPACEFIRGWLNYCLQAYLRLLERRPDYFGLGSEPRADRKP
jgi:uncharacterized protein